MDALSAWLIGTVPGVILLGAVGSLLAVFVLEKSRILAKTWVPRIEIWTGKAVLWWIDRPIEESLRFKLSSDNYDVLAFFAYELGKIVVLTCGALFFLFWAVIAYVTHKPPDLPTNAILDFGFFFLCVYGALKSLVRLWYHRMFTMRGGLYDSTIKEHGDREAAADARKSKS